ncbi:MAG: pentapeptide repeat-containing protein [Candidatus Delongbacteria bacterium]|nr:pentapeptide repeat-containing protein [Candidatus Delongbacteria bacterium]MCG2759612.1 pentapeptide repeat-containing protein [Candidatus Delongbacteria bacterium]
MQEEVIKTIAGYIALAVPITVAVGNFARIAMEWLNQRHKIKSTVIEQTHNITTHYLDRALDPKVPLAFRHQLLRFLGTPDQGGSRLENWAKSELERVGSIVDETNRAVETAEKELHAAQTAAQVAAAEKKLSEAMQRQRSLMEPPVKPPMTAAALRAGLVTDKDLSGIDMKNENLKRMSLTYRKLIGADFSGSDLSDASLQGCDLRAALFVNANLSRTTFYDADLRGANLEGVTLVSNNFQQSRLEGADFRSASIDGVDFGATYDKTTQWPDGFDPDAAGAVRVDAEHVTEKSSDAKQCSDEVVRTIEMKTE